MLIHIPIVLSDPLVFVRTGKYDYLAGVLLAVTDCEAMFAKCVFGLGDASRLLTITE